MINEMGIYQFSLPEARTAYRPTPSQNQECLCNEYLSRSSCGGHRPVER